MNLRHFARFAKVTASCFIILSCSREAAAQQKCKPMQAPRDCSDEGSYTCGIYMTTTGHGDIPTFCDMSTEGKRWVVILRREQSPYHPPLDFDVKWDSYKWGFGSLNGEFWWGLEHIWRLTSYLDREYELRINLVDFDGNHRYALYQNFRVTSEEDGYRLIIGNFSGNAYNALGYHSGMKFTTSDRDNDKRGNANCASTYRGGWWFKDCYRCHLTGNIGNTSNSNKATCWKERKICWVERGLRFTPYKKVTMLIRPAWKDTIGSHVPLAAC